MENWKIVYRPEFVPFYLEEVIDNNLTPVQWLVYWFIRYYSKLDNKWFYFKSEQLASILNVKPWTIDNAISQLEKKWLIRRETVSVVWWWKVRKVYLEKKANVSQSSPISLNNEMATSLNNEIKIEYNKNKNNNIISKEITEAKLLDISPDSLNNFSNTSNNQSPIKKKEKENNNKTSPADLTSAWNDVSDKKYWNAEINELLDIIAHYNAWIIDWTTASQRRFWKLLLDKVKKMEPVKSGKYTWKRLITDLIKYALDNKYYRTKITSPQNMYYNLAELYQYMESVKQPRKDDNKKTPYNKEWVEKQIKQNEAYKHQWASEFWKALIKWGWVEINKDYINYNKSSTDVADWILDNNEDEYNPFI